jgi:mannose-6-phosphate isomerase
VSARSLFGRVRPYAWGSRHFIADLQNRPAPSEEPEAELWLGAHLGAPSRLESPGGESLLAFIAADPERVLGASVSARFGGELPFLLKVLAAAEPLSLQAHPRADQARRGFLAEQARELPLSAETRSYKDDRHKPELIVALAPFTALSGFRRVDRTWRLFRELGRSELTPYVALLENPEPSLGLRSMFERLMCAPRAEQLRIAEATHAGVRAQLGASSEFAAEFRWAARIGELYPGDVGLVGALMLNLLELAPYEGLYLPAGNLHAYLDGAGVEIMASSDNVLRGGLTKKYVDVPELLQILEFAEFAPELLRAAPSATGEYVYATPAEEFRLSYFDVSEPIEIATRGGPEILLVTAGEADLETDDVKLHLARGSAAFVPAATTNYRLAGGSVVFRASVP